MAYEPRMYPAPLLREKLSQLGVAPEHQHIDSLRDMIPTGGESMSSVDAMAEILIYLIGRGIIKAPRPLETAMGNFRPGTHICQLFSSKEELASILAAYYRDGLKNNEQCLCIVSDFLTEAYAGQTFAEQIPGFGKYLQSGQFGFAYYKDFYLTPSGQLKSPQELVKCCMRAEQDALLQGFDGLRGSGDTTWVRPEHWKGLMEYEDKVNSAIAGSSMIGLCAYPIEQCQFSELTEAARHHPHLLAHKNGWCHKIEKSGHEDSFLATLKKAS